MVVSSVYSEINVIVEQVNTGKLYSSKHARFVSSAGSILAH